MRTLFGCTMMLLAFAASAADDKKDEKIDGKKLIGKWEPKDRKLILEFTKDGKLNVTSDEFKIDGSFRLEGNKLTILLKSGENEIKDTVTISKLTDDEMIGESETKKTKETFKRVK